MNHWSKSTYPGSRECRLESKSNGAAYVIRVSCPAGADASARLPVVYVLDGDGLFGTFAEAVGRLSRRPDATNVVPAVVVAIGRGASADDAGRRREDFTPGPAADEPEAGSTGGAAAFFAFLETELLPMIEREFPVDPARRILFGHSLAGYFALHVLTTRPDCFAVYAAVSPSIWWDEASLRAGLAHIGTARPKVFLAAGEWEGELPPWQRRSAAAEGTRARRARRAMIERAKSFAAELESALGPRRVAFHVFPDEDHASVVLVATARMLRFALPAAPDGA